MRHYSFTDTERYQMTGLVDYTNLYSLPELWHKTAILFKDSVALIDPHAKPSVTLTYQQLYQHIQQFATGIQRLELPQDGKENIPCRVALFADNSPRWLIADQGIMLAGAADAVRSAAADREELLYILKHSGSIGLVVENLKTYHQLCPELYQFSLQWVVLLSDETVDNTLPFKQLNFGQIMTLGSTHPLQPIHANHQTLATLIYTSGTTGQPKGVMLTHGNLIHQLVAASAIIQPCVGDRTLSILPTWHSFGRIGEYFTLSQGCTQIYTNRRYLKQDLQTFTPQYMVGVPRLWESIYEGIQKSFRDKPPRMQKLITNFLTISQQYIKVVRLCKGLDLQNLNPSRSQFVKAWVKTILLSPLHFLGEMIVYKKIQQATGGKVKQLISGGGSLAKHLEDFFEIVGIEILVGYGLTETSPVLTARRQHRNLRGASGLPLANTEIKIVDLDNRTTLPPGKPGLVMAKGPQIMQGYYLNPQATKNAIDEDGWFDTGDMGWLTPDNQLVLTGRAKDTIVLSNGENKEPQPIEDACLRSPYIDQIMLVGQDQKSLGALIVPNLEALAQALVQAGVGDSQATVPKNESPTHQVIEGQIDLNSPIVRNLFRQELNRQVRDRAGYRADDQITQFELIEEPFTIENGLLTQTLKIRRNLVADRYRDRIHQMFG
jgi:long-chain acyl-CoA synthetase